MAAALVFAFATVLLYASATGVGYELTNPARISPTYDFAGHSHALMFGVVSLILLVVLLAVMVGNTLDRRHEGFVLGAVVVLWSICPLVAGRFESQAATASAGRWALAIFLLTGATLYAFRERLWPGRVNQPAQLTNSRALLLALTLGPLVLLTFAATVNAIMYVPARGPQSGIFHAMSGVI
ncbi:MAG TPA: hypothetical protein VE863_14190, partial [Pyrinomonadaceae bacterium]|nr:hypothetical protein [Pyrinomonadaceae bacterium]